MELDKRIRAIVDILTVINSDMGGIIGKTGYFGNSIMDFKRLDTCEHGELTGIIRNTDRCFEYENCADSGRQGYCYFIPEDYLLPEEPEKKYRPFSLNEFLNRYRLGNTVYFRRIGYKEVKCAMFVEYVRGESPEENQIVLGNMRYTLAYLFKNHELSLEDIWRPFGVIEDD